MVAKVTAVSPAVGPAGTAITVTGTGFNGCTAQVAFRVGGSTYTHSAVIVNDSTMTSQANGPWDGVAADVGVYDNAAAAWQFLAGAYYFGPTPPTLPPLPPGTLPGVWDETVWDQSSWQTRTFAPGAGWGYDWRVWFQYDTQVLWDMTEATVEVRWSTDGHAAGDGTFRGDIQPGSIQIQLHDPDHLAEAVHPLGTIWLHYGPTNVTWGFYLETVTRQLVAPGDPTAADVVMTGSPWPLRLSSDCLFQFPRPAERADTRLTAIAAFLSQNARLGLPRYSANIAAQSHQVTPTAAVSWNTSAYPSALALVRAAAANGVAWLTGAVDGAGLGYFVLNYARWEANAARNLVPSDLVAGIPFDSSNEELITAAVFQATAPGGTETDWPITVTTSSAVWHYGLVSVTMRVWADITGADQTPINTTGANLLAAHGNPVTAHLSSITATSGLRSRPDGTAGPAWNPAAHVWAPTDRVTWVPPADDPTNWATQYWVTKTDHRLRAAAWDSAHTVELYTPAAALQP